MDKLFELFVSIVNNLEFNFKRYLIEKKDWSSRLTAVTGARGVGKTVMMLQHIRDSYELNEKVLYASMDNIYFSANTLSDLADEFVKNGGEFLFLDEVHKYPDWSIEIKNLYDNYPNLKIVFSGSSILNINKGYADLSRRAVSFLMQGMSFREYLLLEKGIDFHVVSLEDIINNHIDISRNICREIKPIAEFKNYLKYGYYPYYRENKDLYHQKLMNTLNVIIESDLPSVHPIEYKNINKLKKLIYVISSSVPFKANVTKLAERIGVSRNTILMFFDFLEQAQIINYLNTPQKGLGRLTKPEKIYMNNTNQMFAISKEAVNKGNLRETFFFNQISANHKVNLPKKGDFLIDEHFTFEIGGKNKTDRQIKGMPDSCIAMDDIEFGYKNTIPLWLFGFLY